MVWAVKPAWVTLICWPSRLICAVRALDVFAVNEKLTMPLAMAPIVSQLWLLEGAKMPTSDVEAGTTASSVSDPAASGSLKLAGPTKTKGISSAALLPVSAM